VGPAVGAQFARLTSRLLRVDFVEQALHRPAHLRKLLRAHQLRPPPLDIGDPRTRSCHGVSSTLGEVDEFGAAVGGVRPPNQVPHLLEVVHQFRRGGQAQLRPIRQLGEPDPADADIAEDLHVGIADVAEARLGAWSREVESKLAKQPHQQLADGLTIRRQIA
jgi:hypothetical protein